MNERIRALAELCWDKRLDGLHFDQEKFAELIVRECAKVGDFECPRCGHCCPQPNQEPVAWVCEGSAADEKHAVDYQQEDVDAIPIGTMLYATPPQRPWVGLTDEEIKSLPSWWPSYNDQRVLLVLIRDIQAKLKEKNT